MLAQFGMSIPLVAAPMSGGPTTPAMVSAATRAGGLGMLAAGYKTVEAVEAEIKRVRAEGIPFGVNVFAPNPLPVDPDHYRTYAATIQQEAEQFGLTLPAEPIEDTDRFDEKIALLLDDPVPMVSFTFGIPPRHVIAALQRSNSVVVQTVTTPDEAARAHAAGVDMLAVQAAAAGGHSGTLSPRKPLTPVPIVDLVKQITATVPLPVLATGGLATPASVADVIRAGAAAAAVGTILLRANESGASATIRPRWPIPLAPKPCSPGPSPADRPGACAMRSSTPTRRRRPWVIRRFTTSPAHCARPPPRRANPTMSICGRAQVTGTPPPNPQPTFCSDSHPTSDRPRYEYSKRFSTS
jgi:nitronate monooxygenase